MRGTPHVEAVRWVQHAAAASLFILAAIANAWEWLAADRMPNGDFAGYAAQVQFVRDALLHYGRVPLWCTECYGGTTHLTSHLKEYLAFPLALALEPVLATKLAFLLLRVAAAIGLYALATRHFSAPMAGIAAGYVVAFGAIPNHQYEYLDSALSAALLPPTLIAAWALFARGGACPAIALGVLAACQFANNPVHAVPMAFAVGLVAIFGPRRTRATERIARPLALLPTHWGVGIATAVFLAFAGSSLAWLAYDARNHRLIPRETAAAEARLWVSRSPFLFVNRADALAPWLADHRPRGFDLATQDAGRSYVGVVLIAIVAAGSWAARRDPQLSRWAGIAAGSLLFQYWLSLGPWTLLWEVGESLHISAGQQALASTALRALAALCALAAAGVWLASRGRVPRFAKVSPGRLLTLGLLAFFPTASLWGASARVLPWIAGQRSPGHYFDTAHFWLALLLAIGWAALQRRVTGRRRTAWIAAAAVAALVADYWPSRAAFVGGVPMSSMRRAAEALQSLPGEGGTLRIGPGWPFPYYSPTGSWIAAQSRAGLAWGWLSWRAGAYWGRLIDPAVEAAAPTRTGTAPDATLLAAARVRYWLVSSRDAPLQPPWRRLVSQPAFTIWELPSVAPIATGWREVWLGGEPDDPALLARAIQHDALVVSGVNAARFLRAGGDPGAPPVAVTYRRPSPEHISLSVDAGPEPAMILANEGYHPWWRATVDEAPAPVLRAQLAMLAVPVGAGPHRIDLRLEPPGPVKVADRVTALSWIALAVGTPIMVLIHARRSRRASSSAQRGP